MADATTIRWGIVGTGAIAQRFARDLSHVPGTALTAVWGRTPANAAAFAESFRCPRMPSLEALLQAPLDAVYIATLPDTHASFSIAALNAGKAVLCEKPVAMNLRELEDVLAVANARNLLFMEAMKPAFYPVYRKLLEHLAQDRIGPIRFVRSGFAAVTPPGHTSWDTATGGGALLSIGVYHAFLAHEWLGEVTSSHTLRRQAPGGVDAFAAITTEHAQGGIAQLFCGLDISTPGDAVLAGTLGYITLHENWWNPQRISITYHDGRRIALHEPIVGTGLNYETAHFCDLLRTASRQSPILPHASSRAILRLIDRARG